jgi:ubiquinone/menaquinone biosynthesis C-methylase UbiE
MRTRRVITREQAAELDLPTRIRLEQAITDGKAAQYRRQTSLAESGLPTYARQSPWRQWMFDFLGPVSGRTVLDLGCGFHPTPIYLAAAGAARVYACDISVAAVAHVTRMAREHGLEDRVTGLVCAAEQLPFRDGEIDCIHGEAVLHHLSLPLASREIARVLKPGGRAAFKDPLGENAVLELARDYLKPSAKATDRPLRFAQLDEFGQRFRTCRYRGFGLLAMTVALGGRRRWSRAAAAADAVDGVVLRRLPFLQRYTQYVVTCVEA